MYSVIGNAINHPDLIDPYIGLFNHRILNSLSEKGISIQGISPRPFAPPIGPYSAYSGHPEVTNWGSYSVYHPKFWYLLPKRMFYAKSGDSYARRIPKYIEENFDQPDIVHACHIFPDGYGMLPYVKTHDIPLFVVSHGHLINGFGNHPPGIDKRIKQTLEVANGVLCVSDALTERTKRITSPQKVQTVPIGASPEKFPNENRDSLRQEMNIGSNTTVVLFVGQFSARKGVKELISILPNLQISNTLFVFIGNGGPLEMPLRKAIVESDFPSHYFYTGITSLALRRWFVMADLLLLPSHSEGRPTVIYEAMASKTAVLATNVGGVPEQVIDGETGILIDPEHKLQLVETLTRLTQDTFKLEAMGQAGFDRLRTKNWTWRGHAKRVQTIHSTAL